MHQINFTFTNMIFWFGDLVYFPCVYQRYLCICACALITEARRRNRILWDRSYRCLWIRWVLGTNPGPLQEQKLPFTLEPAPQPQRLACFKINIKGKILPSAIFKKQIIQIIWIFYFGHQGDFGLMASNSKQTTESCVSAPSSTQLYMLVLRNVRWTYLRTSKSLSIIHINIQFRSIRIKYSD